MSQPKNLPVFIAVITYPQVKDCRHTRYKYAQSKAELNELLSNNWREGAKAKLYKSDYEEIASVNAQDERGLWSCL